MESEAGNTEFEYESMARRILNILPMGIHFWNHFKGKKKRRKFDKKSAVKDLSVSEAIDSGLMAAGTNALTVTLIQLLLAHWMRSNPMMAASLTHGLEAVIKTVREQEADDGQQFTQEQLAQLLELTRDSMISSIRNAADEVNK